MTSGDWLPAQAPFDLVRRGYSPEQVTAHLERLEYDLRITTANRDATNQRLTELGAQLSAAQGEVDSLRAQLDRTALEPVSMTGLSDRMQRMIRLAEEEAGEIRARAQADSAKQRSELEGALTAAADNRTAFDSERERTRKQLAEQVRALIAEATAEAEETRRQSQAEATRLLAEATGQAERTAREAREFAERTTGEANRAGQAELGQAKQEATRARQEAAEAAEAMTTQARQAADSVTAESAAERERRDTASAERRRQVEEDFDIAITTRRAEAMKTITDQEQGSAFEADRLVSQASQRSEELVATAQAESDLLAQRAHTYADALVERAAAESHQRVSDADHALSALHELRDRLNEQLRSLIGHLDHLRDLAGSAPDLLSTSAREVGRPRAEQFPADPAQRPTDVGLPVPVLEVAPSAGGQSTAGAPTTGAPQSPVAAGQGAVAGADPNAAADSDSAGDHQAENAPPGDGSVPVSETPGPDITAGQQDDPDAGPADTATTSIAAAQNGSRSMGQNRQRAFSRRR